MKKQALILVTNDDGIEAQGIRALADGLHELGDVVVMAPDGPRSGMSTAITTNVSISYTCIERAEGLTVYRCTGTPTDCVKLYLNEVADRKPDLVVSRCINTSRRLISPSRYVWHSNLRKRCCDGDCRTVPI